MWKAKLGGRMRGEGCEGWMQITQTKAITEVTQAVNNDKSGFSLDSLGKSGNMENQPLTWDRD